MKFVTKTILICVLLLPGFVAAQEQLVGAITGTVSGLVENDKGEMVAPQTAVQATIVAETSGDSVIATVTGTASCTAGLGLHFTFEAQYNSADNSFVGMYSDTPGLAPNKALSFANDGGYSWTASLSGNAPSDTGSRAYDLKFDFEIPETAVFSGNSLPDNLTYGGSLNTTKTVIVPVVVPLVNLNQTLEFDVVFTGEWSAVSVPLPDGTSTFTGLATGSFESSNTETITVTAIGLGTLSIPVKISGSFGGTLFLVDEDTVSFQGSWVGSALDHTYGGDTNINIEFQDTSSFPFSVRGVLPVDTGYPQLGVILFPFSIDGNFPLSIQ